MAKEISIDFMTSEVGGSQNTKNALNERVMERYKTLFNSNMFGIAATDFDDSVLSANDAFLSMLGYTRADLDNGLLKWSTISPTKYDEADMQKMSELLAHKTIVPFEKEYIHKDGHIVPVLVGAEAFDDNISYGVCFALDISEMKQLEQKKDDFIGTVSHELKTPLSIMKLYANFLETAINDGASKEELLESANEINNQIDKLNILITDLLNMARYQSQEAAFPIAGIDLRECVRKVIAELSLVHDRNIVFQGERSVFINGNTARLSQVVTNLVNNAIRYSNPDTDIIVRTYQDHEFAYVQVEDFGIGIREEDQERIFERYYRINHADDYAEKAAGIGLYICNEIIKFHKGTIEVESSLGKGSTFTIKIPLIKPH
jgi:PAS domain S-box-containing protein